MLVLGLDPSLTNFGWALHDTEASGFSRCPRRGRFQTSARTLYIARYEDLRSSLQNLIRELDPDKIGIEFPVFGDLYSEGLYGLFLFCSEAIRSCRRDVVFWSPLQIKAHARESLGRPKSWVMMKPDMVEAAKQDAGGTGQWNHNEADAYLCARLSARFWSRHDGILSDSDLTAVEQRYFTLVKQYTRGKKAGKEERKGLLFREDERFFRWSEDSDGIEKGNGTQDRQTGDDLGCGEEDTQD